MRKALRKAVAELPVTEVGAIPDKRPATTPSVRSPKSTERRKRLKEMFIASGIPRSTYTEESIESLLDAMEAYMDDVIA